MSRIWGYIKDAIKNIRSNRGRSFLTMLGIIIGISSVIMLVAIGNGVKNHITKQMKDLESSAMRIGINDKIITNHEKFTQSDIDAIVDKVAHVMGATQIKDELGMAFGRKGSLDTMIKSGNEYMEYVKKQKIVKGRYFTKEESELGKRVCIISEDTAKELYGTTNVVGMEFELNLGNVTNSIKIVGISENKKDITDKLYGDWFLGELEMPINTLMNSYGSNEREFSEIDVILTDSKYSEQVGRTCIRLLEARHHCRGENLFSLPVDDGVADKLNEMLNTLSVFISLVAAISLLVGGIGVMNIMMVSVTERTREIGIRKALGARTNSILIQFLAESSMITLLGGIIGIVIGLAGAYGVCAIIKYKAAISFTTILAATLFSSAVGIFFGIYPARKAAKLKPIEALRHE